MSSTFYVGPFGRMLPVADGPSEREPDRPANLPVTGSHPYQLPPPRALAPLQFGTDPFLRPRNRGDEEVILNHSKAPSYQQTTEQLPSVSQLLTPTVQSSRSPSPYNPSVFGILLPPNDVAESTEQFRHSDAGPAPPEARSNTYDNSGMLSDPMLQQQSRNLPSIAQISANGLGSDSVYANRHPNSPHQSYHPNLYQHHGSRSLDRESGGFPSPEIVDPGSIGKKKSKQQVRPHVVDERYIEGEGLCYIYADGSHCPKTIDGIPVNANWGVTKAGKPRKRLAQACLTCREKKIKCQPNLPKCDQCQKSGRECRFESAPRGHRAAWKASQYASKYDARDNITAGNSNSAGTSNSLYSVVRASESSTSLPGTNSQSPLSDGSMLTPSAVDSNHDSAPDIEQFYGARARRVSSGREDAPRRSIDSIRTSSTDYAEILMEIKDLDTQDPLTDDWKIDPFDADPELAVHFIEMYFTYVNDRLYYMFPRRRFLLWLRSCRTKSLDDNMLLYSMMALGSVFSDRPDKLAVMKRCSRTSRYAIEHSQHSLSLQLAQSRIIISLWYYAIGALVKSWDAAGAAVRTVCGLRYNVEMGGVIVDQSRPCEYGLHPQALIECRRRTFWVAFLMDRLSCFYAPATTFISSQTAFLRLPCREEVYEAQEYTTVPFFQSFLNQVPASQEDELSGLSAMALLIDVMSIWGDVSDHVFRLSLIPNEAYNKLFDEFYSTVARRSDEWLARLPNHLTFTAVNLERGIRGKKVDSFISIHLLYHATLMKLNRYTRHQLLRPGAVNQYIHTARNHAVEILQIALALVRYASEYEVSQMSMEPSTPKGSLLNPFLGYVILSAVDVLSAGGLMVDMPECISLIRSGLDVARELSSFWGNSLQLVSLIETRLEFMTDALHRMDAEGKVAFFFDGPSLDSQIHTGVQKQDPTMNEDLMYGGLPREQMFGAFGLADVPFVKDNMLWIKGGN